MSRLYIITTLLLTVACGNNAQLDADDKLKGDSLGGSASDDAQNGDDHASDQKPTEGWSSNDDPSLFSDELIFDVDALPLEGEATPVPWTGNYWPTYKDSINHRWDGDDTQSPAEKYGEAFGIDDIADKVSKNHGIDKYKSRTTCKDTDECDSAKSESCAIRDGEESGYCIPIWWGICHAWAPVSMMEPEPERAVTRNGVEFKVQDIKALITLSYNATSSRFVSLRCNENNGADEIEYDEYDRPTGEDVECRDTNPGTYHVLLANYLGIKGESFVEDRTFDYQVWNQPLRGYKITQMEPISIEQAHDLIGVPENPPPEDEEGGNGAQVHHSVAGTVANQGWNHHGGFDVSGASTVTVTMGGASDEAEADDGADAADLYVRFGADPSETEYHCSPQLEGQDEVCTLDVPAGIDEVFVSVVANGDDAVDYVVAIDVLMPNENDTTDANDAVEYKFNVHATELYHVKLDVTYISESHSMTDGNLADRIDNYTKTDRYQYVLEVDANNQIIGGEWIGSSKQNHPDFLWLPTDRRDWPRVADGAISYDVVKDLIESSVSSDLDEESNATTDSTHEEFEVDHYEWKHLGPYTSNGSLKVEMSGTGDGDLYVRRDAQPDKQNYDCRPYEGTSREECIVSGPGEFYVSVYGYQTSEIELTITMVTGEGNEPGESDETDEDTVEVSAPDHLDESGALDYQEMALYVLDVNAGDNIQVQTTSTNDVDIYLRFDNPPTTDEYDSRAYNTTGNESLSFTATSAGVLHIGVHGWEEADFTLVTSDG